MIRGSFKVTWTQPCGKELQKRQRSSEDTAAGECEEACVRDLFAIVKRLELN